MLTLPRRRLFSRRASVRRASPCLFDVMEARELLSGGPLQITFTELQTGQSVTVVDNGSGDSNSASGAIVYSSPTTNPPFRDFQITNYQAFSNRTTAPTTAILTQSGTVSRTTTAGANCTLQATVQDVGFLFPATATTLTNAASSTFTNGHANVDNVQFQSTFINTANTVTCATVSLTSNAGNPDSHDGASTPTPIPNGNAPFNLQNVYTIVLAQNNSSTQSVSLQGTGTTTAPGTNGSLSGNVYLDSDFNGTLSTGDSPIGSVTITLTGTDAVGNPVSKTTTTNASGAYSFPNLTTGTYQVTETQPAGYTQGENTPGIPTDGTVSGDTISSITINGAQNLVHYDFGETKPVTIGDYVWNDANANGIQDSGELGINGVTLTLTGTNAYGVAVTDNATTSSNGAYLFSEVPGTYTVTVDSSNFSGSGALVGYNASPTLQGSNTAIDSNPNPSGTTPSLLGNAGSDLTIDFGYYKNVAIGNFVWNDLNGNGVQDGGEPGIAGVMLTLTGTTGSGQSITETTTTDASGLYLFTEAPGTYTVTVDAGNFSGSGNLAGYTASPTLVGSDRTIDSNPNPSGTTPSALPGGSSDLTIDFGYLVPANSPPNTGAEIEPPHTACSTVVYALTHGLQGQSKVNVHAAVPNGKIGRGVTPPFLTYYVRFHAPSATFQIDVNQALPTPLPPLSVLDRHVTLHNGNLEVLALPPHSVTFTSTDVKIDVSGLTRGAVYYVGIRYSTKALVGRPWPFGPSATVYDTFKTTLSMGGLVSKSTVKLPIHDPARLAKASSLPILSARGRSAAMSLTARHPRSRMTVRRAFGPAGGLAVPTRLAGASKNVSLVDRAIDSLKSRR